MLTGVVEVGLFCHMAKAAYFGNQDGSVTAKWHDGKVEQIASTSESSQSPPYQRESFRHQMKKGEVIQCISLIQRNRSTRLYHQSSVSISTDVIRNSLACKGLILQINIRTLTRTVLSISTSHKSQNGDDSTCGYPYSDSGRPAFFPNIYSPLLFLVALQ